VAAAVDELRRAEQAGQTINAYTRARTLRLSGHPAEAQAALAADNTPLKNENPQMRQLRLDVAFESREGKAAADVIADEYSRTRNAARLSGAYAHLLYLDPGAAWRRDLSPVAVSLLTVAVMIALSPGLLMFPVHYRGVVRARKGKTSEPLFAGIGLKEAWYALSVFLVALSAVTAVRTGYLSAGQARGSSALVDWQRGLVATHVAGLLISALCLARIARRVGWRGWGWQGAWKPVWVVPAAGVLALNLLLGLAASRAAHAGASQSGVVSFAQSIVLGAKAIGSLPLVIAIACVAVPLIEELVFRGALLGGLSRHLSFGWANAIQAVLFALMHQDARAFAFLFLLALVAGWLVRKTRGLAMAVLLHGINNAIFVAFVV
jgi:uncharacterized protein